MFEILKKTPSIRYFIYLLILFESIQRIFSFAAINFPVNKIFLSFFLLFITYQSLKEKIFSKKNIYFFIMSFFLILNILLKKQVFIDNMELSMFSFPFFFIITSYVIKNAKHLKKQDLIYISYYIATLILLGLIFKIKLFKTYIYGSRFGHSGLIRSSIISFIAYSLYVLLSRKKYQKYILFFIGTKAFYLGTLLYELKLMTKNKKFIKPFIFIISLPIILYQFSAFRKTINLFIKINNEKGIITSILSYRDVLVKNAWDYVLQNWDFMNYLIGDPTLFYEYRTEMAFFDLLFNFGLLGLVCFLITFILLLWKRLNSNYLILLLIAFIIGNFFTSPIAIFFSSLLLTTKKDNES